jgi:hypothetical protein
MKRTPRPTAIEHARQQELDLRPAEQAPARFDIPADLSIPEFLKRQERPGAGSRRLTECQE